MKTENFDDAIKRKVESIDHRFEAKDIDKVLGYVRAHRGPLLFRNPFRRLMIFSVSGLLLTAVVTWQLTRWHDRKILNETVAELTKATDKKQSSPSTGLNITQEKKENGTTENNKASNEGNILNDKTISQLNHTSNNNVNTFNIQSNRPVKNTRIVKKEDGDVRLTDNSNSKNKETDRKLYGNKDRYITEKQDLQNPGKQQENLAQKKEDTEIKENETQKVTVTEKKDDKTLTENKKPEDPNSVNGYRDPKNDKKVHKPLAFNVMAGLSGIAGNNTQIGAGLTGELLVNHLFSFSTGVRVLNVNNISEPYSEKDYDDKCGQDFHNHYEPDKDRSQVKYNNITTKSSVIQVPVALSVYLPIKRILDVSFSLGTDLDIYKYQQVSFTEKNLKYPYPYPPEWVPSQQNRSNNGKGVLFNNLVGSIGISKQIGHFVFQVNPYYAYQLKLTDYKLEDSYMGANFRVLYSFGK